jgi:hypothetical protein
MGFDSRDTAERYVRQDNDSLEDIAQRATEAGNPITWQEISRYNWGTDRRDQVNEFMRDELGCRKRDTANNFIIALDDEPHSDLLIPRRFNRDGLPVDRTHTLRVRRREAPPQFLDCFSIPGVTFEFDKSFVRPSVVDHLQPLEEAIARHPEAKIMIFGHTDKVGSDQYNKLLSERRARSVYAFIINDPDTWEELYNHPNEQWGVAVIQEILLDLGHDPGPIDGVMGPQTRSAMQSFDPTATSNNAAFRRRLFLAYMTGRHDVEVNADQFMEPRHMGCGEFNPLLPVEGRCEANRRVTFYLFHPERLPRLPCRAGDIGPCQHQMTPASPRHRASFRCSFYDSLALRCPCEHGGNGQALVHISVLLRSNSGAVALSNKQYRIQLDEGRVLEGTTDDDGLVSHDEVPPGDWPLELDDRDTGTRVPTAPRSMERIPLRVIDEHLAESTNPIGPADADPDESLQVNELGENDGGDGELSV